MIKKAIDIIVFVNYFLIRCIVGRLHFGAQIYMIPGKM